MAAMASRNVASPRLERQQWWVGEVEEMVVELWVRGIGQRCGGGGARARRRHTAMATAVRATIAATGGRAEERRVQMSKGEAAVPCLHPWACQHDGSGGSHGTCHPHGAHGLRSVGHCRCEL